MSILDRRHDFGGIAIAWNPPPLPDAWRVIEQRIDGIAARRRDGLCVIASCAIESDGNPWLHVSASKRDRLPTWEELTTIKEVFIGDGYAYQVFPPRDKYVNLHPYVLHLWHPLEHQPLPEFSGFIKGRRSI